MYECPDCDVEEPTGSYTVRVTGGSFDAAHLSVYGCPSCSGRKLAEVRREFPDAAVHPLPVRAR